MKMIYFLLLSFTFSGSWDLIVSRIIISFCGHSSGVLSLKRFDGMGNIHGIPFENTTRACGPGVLNCYKITASKETVHCYTIQSVWNIPYSDLDQQCGRFPDWPLTQHLFCTSPVLADTDINQPINSWGCGVKLSRSGCEAGVPDGVVFDVGDVHYTAALTCFCTGDLCNSEHWCDTCRASGVEGSGLAGRSILALALGWMLFLLS